ncbi:MAG TPA: DUF4412 domain-containing protein [Flavobacteriales bacterium]|nr:DUF4412 domain-containing protein [Flavobacteriales bacterium]
MKITHLLSFATAAILLGNPATAQIDINAILQQNGSGMQLVPDTDPFTPNTFVGSFTMEMHLFENGKEQEHSPANTTIHSSAEKIAIESQTPGVKEKMRMIIDQKEKWQYMLMDDGAGTRMAMKTRKMKVVNDNPDAHLAGDVRMTDETKTIDGHLCKKMTATDSSGTWIGWMAQDIDVPFHSFMKSVSSTGGDIHDDALVGVHGFPLEYEWTSTDGKERVQCTIRDLKMGSVDEKAFSLEGYQVMEIPTLPMGR